MTVVRFMLTATTIVGGATAGGGGARADMAPGQAAPAAGQTPESAVIAETRGATMDHAISVFANLGYDYGFAVGLGVGARYQWVVVPKGFIRFANGMHDEFAIEPGFDFFHAGYSTGVATDRISWSYDEFTPLVGFEWNLWLTNSLSVYPKVDVGYRIAAWSASVNGHRVSEVNPDVFPLYFQGAAGINWRLGNFALRAEGGWEELRVGGAYVF